MIVGMYRWCITRYFGLPEFLHEQLQKLGPVDSVDWRAFQQLFWLVKHKENRIQSLGHTRPAVIGLSCRVSERAIRSASLSTVIVHSYHNCGHIDGSLVAVRDFRLKRRPAAAAQSSFSLHRRMCALGVRTPNSKKSRTSNPQLLQSFFSDTFRLFFSVHSYRVLSFLFKIYI